MNIHAFWYIRVKCVNKAIETSFITPMYDFLTIAVTFLPIILASLLIFTMYRASLSFLVKHYHCFLFSSGQSCDMLYLHFSIKARSGV